ncbi:hypothetical protein EOD39_8968 [Acipenser ruthenus]|uniref:Uncharacterized protein n=1 Tax=Acipenser ruthenus TaxID=7906 RepID=A0A444U272_ACIRT|nr:hypothetical protein EOD39_8968 [Acipenser ruthenus]
MEAIESALKQETTHQEVWESRSVTRSQDGGAASLEAAIGWALDNKKEEFAEPDGGPEVNQNVNIGQGNQLTHSGQGYTPTLKYEWKVRWKANNCGLNEWEKATHLFDCITDQVLENLQSDITGILHNYALEVGGGSLDRLRNERCVVHSRGRDGSAYAEPTQVDVTAPIAVPTRIAMPTRITDLSGNARMRGANGAEVRPYRSTVRAGCYNGTTNWEAYLIQFKMTALINQWSPSEKAGQLAAALEGEATQALLDLRTTEIEDYEALLTALERRFGRSEPAVGFRQQLAVRMRRPEERLGVLSADVLYLARRVYPDQLPVVHQHFATEAFICTAPASLE